MHCFINNLFVFYFFHFPVSERRSHSLYDDLLLFSSCWKRIKQLGLQNSLKLKGRSGDGVKVLTNTCVISETLGYKYVLCIVSIQALNNDLPRCMHNVVLKGTLIAYREVCVATQGVAIETHSLSPVIL